MVISGARHVSKDSKPVHCVELFWSQRSWVLTNCVLSYCPEIVPLSKLLTHILKDCSLTSEVVDSTDPRKFKDTRCDEITVPCIHEGKLNYDRGCVNILKLDADKYFLFCCIPQWTLSRFLIYTFFIGVPEEAKQYHFTLKLKSQKDGQTLERKSPVIFATTYKFFISDHPDVILIPFSELREKLNITTSSISFLYEVQVLENVWNLEGLYSSWHISADAWEKMI